MITVKQEKSNVNSYSLRNAIKVVTESTLQNITTSGHCRFRYEICHCWYETFSYFSGASAAGCGASWGWSEQRKRSKGCAPVSDSRLGLWAHSWTLSEIQGTPTPKYTRVSLRAGARVASAVRESAEGLSNNNNDERPECMYSHSKKLGTK